MISSVTPLFGATSQPIPMSKLSPNTPQGLEGGFWRVDNNFDPVIRFKNVLLNQPLSVTPVLYFADGTEYQLPLVTLEPAGTWQINIRLALQSAPASVASHLSSYGMAGISYKWSWPAVIATIQNTDEISSITHTSSFRADVRKVHAKPAASQAQVTRGQWWLPTANADGFLALENPSLSPKLVDVQFSGHAGKALATQQVSLPSHATTLIQFSAAFGAARGTETAGSIEIHYTGPEYGVIAYAGIEDEKVGYSASPIMIEDHLDPARPAHQVTLNAPGLLLGDADPSMLFPSGTYFKPYAYLHNVSVNALQVTLSLISPGNDGTPQTYPLGQVSLAPGETSQFDFESQFGTANPLPNGYGHLTATFNGQDGDLQMSTGSMDQSQTYVFEVTPSQQADSISRTICFWSVEGDNDTMMTVWNYKPTAQNLVLTLYYSGGQYKIPVHLEARQSYNLDVMSLVHSRIPDPNGALIPSNINSGSAVLSGAGGNFDTISVAVASSVYNVRNATCGTICTTCNGYTEAYFDQSSYTLPIGGTVQSEVTVDLNTGESEQNPFGSGWTNGSSSAFSVNSSGVITGQSSGQGGVGYYLSNVYIGVGQICSEVPISCPVGGFSGGGVPVYVVDATPTISGISPDIWHSSTSSSTTTQVTFTGQHFGTAQPSLGFSQGGISVTSYASYSDTQIVANITVAQNTPTESVEVTVTNNGYGNSAFNGSGAGQSPTSAQANATVLPLSSSCPTTITVGNGTVEKLLPGSLTGVGSFFPMTVGPGTANYDGTPIYETVTPKTSGTTCPTSITSGICQGMTAPFSVGSADTFNGTPAPATQNVFWDQHVLEANFNMLTTDNKGASCQIVCTQTYQCGDMNVGNGFTITLSLTPGTANSIPITVVTATKAAN